MADTIEDAIEQNAISGRQFTTVDGVQTQKFSIGDQIKAAQFVGSQTAAAQPHFGLRFTKLIHRRDS